MGITPAMGLSLLRHLWGGQGSHNRVPITGVVVIAGPSMFGWLAWYGAVEPLPRSP